MEDKTYLIISLAMVAVVGIVAMVIFSKNQTPIATVQTPYRMTPNQYFGGYYGQ